MENTKIKKSVSEWKALVAEFQKPHRGRAWWQVINTVGSVILLWVAIYFTLPISWLLTCTLAVLAGLILVRAFIIFHDCGHGSFFKSRKANQKLGFITGLLTFTPFHHWRWEHSVHHATTGDLSRRAPNAVTLSFIDGLNKE